MIKLKKPAYYISIIASAIIFISLNYAAFAQNEEPASDVQVYIADDDFMAAMKLDAKDISLKVLLNMEIISLSKKKENIMDAASSIYVLKNDDIMRSRALRLMDLLNLVPGMQVQEFTYTKAQYAVRESVKEDLQSVLVLVDGVPINSYYTGVLQFHLIDIPLLEIQSIEVIKGPGGTIYGANANTGIINIFTKKPKDSEGIFISLEGSSLNYISPFFRIGTKITDNIAASIYGKCLTAKGYPKTDIFDGPTVTDPVTGTTSENIYPEDDVDGMNAVSGGISLQWSITDSLESLTMFKYSYTESDVYAQRSRHMNDPAREDRKPFVLKEWGQNIIISERIDYEFNKDHNFFINTYFKNNRQKTLHGGGILTHVNVFEFEIQDNIQLFDFNNISFGGNLRLVKYDAHNPGIENDVNYENPKALEKLYAGFIQDKIDIGEYVDFTIGVKAETWTLVDDKPEFSPSARLSVKPDENLVFWSALSRSITTPSYIQTNGEFRIFDISSSPSQNYYITVVANDKVKPTSYITYEFGTRIGLMSMLYLDLSSFLAEYDNGISAADEGNPYAPSNVNPGQINYEILYDNETKGKIWGGEAVAKISPIKNLHTELSYSLFDRKDEYISGKNFDEDFYTTSTSKHIVRLKQHIDFPDYGFYLTIRLSYLSEFKRGGKYNYVYQTNADNEVGGNISGIHADPAENEWKLDISIEERLLEDKLKIFAWGKNLLAGPHVEVYTGMTTFYPHTIERSFGGGVSYEF